MMNISRTTILTTFVLIASLWAMREMQIHAKATSRSGVGADLIVGGIPDIHRWGTENGETSFSIATTCCNVGDSRVNWIWDTNVHPVISQNLYRVSNGRIEQIAMSWLKHGFSVAASSLCNQCTDPASDYLGVGCSDPYSAGLNGGPLRLGPRSEVNAATGIFPYPYTELPETGRLPGRLRAQVSDLDPALNAGARYFVESQYIHPEDAAAGNGNNNASYREAFLSSLGGSEFDLNVSGASPTVRELPAIFAWQAVHADVELYYVDIPNDGRVIVGIRSIPVGDDFHTEIAIENLNSHRSIGSLGVNFGSGTISNTGFHDADYQYEPYSDTDWVATINGNQIEWSTEEFSTNQDANAIRWNTLYSFWCDSDYCAAQLTLGIFRPGGVSEVSIDLCDATVNGDVLAVTRGTQVAGDLAALADSDNTDLSIQRAQADIQSRTEFQVKGVSPFEVPSSLEVTLEGAVFARSQIIQSIELFDYDLGQWEKIDSRPANRFNDATVTVSATGDLSRFVESGSNCLEARVRYQSGVARQNFSSNTDRFSWTIGN